MPQAPAGARFSLLPLGSSPPFPNKHAQSPLTVCGTPYDATQNKVCGTFFLLRVFFVVVARVMLQMCLCFYPRWYLQYIFFFLLFPSRLFWSFGAFIYIYFFFPSCLDSKTFWKVASNRMFIDIEGGDCFSSCPCPS